MVMVMVPPRPRPNGPAKATLAALLAALMLGASGCAGEPGERGEAATGTRGPALSARPVRADPPGAALPLSIGGRAEAPEGDPLTSAIHCAAALGLTAQRLEGGAAQPFGAEIRVIDQARDFFLARARESAPASHSAAGSLEAAVARRSEEKRGEPGPQAQLAIACLRRFGAAMEASERPVSGATGVGASAAVSAGDTAP